MPVPLFDPATGFLPPGEHAASWDDVLDRFGWNPVRRRQLDGLAEALHLLAEAGCEPVGVDTDTLDPIFFDLADGRRTQKTRFGGELLPDITELGSGLRFAEFFQRDRSGQPKGIILLELKATNP